MPTAEKIKAGFAEALNDLRPVEFEIDRLRLTVYPEQRVIVIIGIIKNDEIRQPHILEVGKVVAALIRRGCNIEKIIPYPIAQGSTRDKMGALIIYK